MSGRGRIGTTVLRALALAGWMALVAIRPASAQIATFGYSGAKQTYTVPAGATGVLIQAAGAGGGGGGADQNGPGAAGGSGATVTGFYSVTGGTVLNVYVGGGGAPGFTSNFGHTCANSAGAGGGAGGGGGFAGGAGGPAGCSGWSGSGGGGGAASVVASASNAALVIAGGGGGGQGGSWNSTSVPSQNSTSIGSLPGSAGAVGSNVGNNDGGGGGGGGGGCPGGVGGTTHADNSGTAYGTAAGAGGSCANGSSISNFTVLASPGGAGGAGDPASDGTSDPNGSTAGGSGSVTITPVYPVTGTVYADTDHNAVLDAGETGTGISGLYIKLTSAVSGTCQSPASAAAAVNAGTGAYALPALAPGNYCLILTNSASLSNISPYAAPGWIGTQNSSATVQLSLGGYAPAPQNFGLFNGAQAAVQVFADTGASGGTANDGVKNGAESGIAGVAVNATSVGNVVASAVTNSSGSAVLWLPAASAGAIAVTPVSPAGYLATGGSAGTTPGSYVRPSVNFSFAAGGSYTGVSFGLVPPNSFAPNGALTAQPATSVFYAHSFTAGSAGQVTFTTSASPSPNIAGWNEVLYLDAACSGQYASGDPVIAAPIAAIAQQQICVLVKDFVPAGAPANAQNAITVNASFAYSGAAAPGASVQTATDKTTVVGSGTVQLSKLVQNVTQGGAYGATGNALPGNTLQYQLTIFNQGSAPLSNVVVNDATPAYTSFLSAACPAPAALPAGLTACAVTQQPAAGAQGALTWTFTGTLAPGAQTAVTYKVQIAQ